MSFVGHPINISAELTWESLSPHRITVRLVQTGQDGRPDQVLDTRPADVSDTGKQTVTFSVKNDDAGFYRYAIVTDPLDEEFNKQNNRDQTDVITLKEKIRILLVEGNPYWETKYLVQFLQKDESVDIKSIFMLTRGKAFEIGKVDSAAAADTESLRFPETIEELQKYNVVILGQDVRFLIEPRHATLLESYLYDHGGALLFARGKPSAGEFPQLAKLEPIVWGNPLAAQSESARGREMKPTELGVQLLLFQNTPQQPLAEAMRILPPVSPRHQVERLKSFAEVLAYTVSGAEEIPAVVVRKMGKGVVATVNAEGLWRWDFLPPRLKQYQGFYPTFWGQLIRWMALRSDFLPGQNISFRSSGLVFRPGQPVQFTVMRRFQAGPPPQLAIRVYDGTEVVQTLIPTPSRANVNVWHALCFLETPEAVEARHYEAKLFDGDTAFDKMTIALTVKPRASETTELSADPEYLDSLARQTGAKLVRPDEINGVIAELEKDYSPSARERKEWRLAWDSAWFLLAAAACVAGEWTWRRRKGLL